MFGNMQSLFNNWASWAPAQGRRGFGAHVVSSTMFLGAMPVLNYGVYAGDVGLLTLGTFLL